jgi:hypothetical protein
MQSVLFMQLVVQQSSMAMMFLGQTPHPETGKTVHDLEAARLFIDQIEMLQTKTRGNLSKEEEGFLKQTLMTLRMAFVEAAEKPLPSGEKPAEVAPKAEAEVAATEKEKSAAEPTPENKAAPAESTGAEESKKRFSKKFSL